MTLLRHYLLLLFAFSLSAAAEPNLQTLASPEQGIEYARELAKNVWQIDERIAGRVTSAAPILSIVHFGKSVPPGLASALIELQRERQRALRSNISLSFVARLESPDSLEANLTLAEAQAIAEIEGQWKLGHGTDLDPRALELGQSQVREATARSRGLLQSLLGLPEQGLTFWSRVTRTASQRMADLKSAGIQAAWAAVPMAVSLHIAEASGRPAHVIAGTLALSAWVAVNSFWKSEINEAMTQGKRLTIRDDGRIEVTPGHVFSTLANIVRSIITNFIVVTSAFGPEAAFSLPGLGLNLSNSVWNAFARGWVDRWIAAQYQLGHWSRRRFSVAIDIWNNLYATGKNLHLLGIGGLASVAYKVLAVCGIASVFVKERFSIRAWRQARQERESEHPIRPVTTVSTSDCESTFRGILIGGEPL